MITVAVIGDRYFGNHQLIWQVLRSLPDYAQIALGVTAWSGRDTAEKAAKSRGLPVIRMAIFAEQIDTLIVFTDTSEYIGQMRDLVRAVQQRGLPVERYSSASSARLPQLQMRLW